MSPQDQFPFKHFAFGPPVIGEASEKKNLKQTILLGFEARRWVRCYCRGSCGGESGQVQLGGEAEVTIAPNRVHITHSHFPWQRDPAFWRVKLQRLLIRGPRASSESAKCLVLRENTNWSFWGQTQWALHDCLICGCKFVSWRSSQSYTHLHVNKILLW